MIRVLLYVLLIAALGLGFAWLADRPGDMVVTFDGYQYQVSLMVAAVAVTAVVAAVMIGWWLLKAIWHSPYTISRYFRVRQRDRGYQALSTGMIAAGAGDAVKARQLNKQAAKLIRSDQEPLIHLLEAQALELEGNHAAARGKYEQMIDDPEMRLLGLRGLYLAAERVGDKAAARHYASRAADIAPHLGWAGDETISEKTEEGDWDGALKLVDAQRASGYADKPTASRRRAVLLTGKAMALFETDFAAARAAALEANRLEPGFVPAAVVAARALFRGDEVRKGSKLLEAAWREAPHPDIAELYTHARAGDATHDRLHRAEKLESLRQNNVESSLIVARAALDAKELGLAREAAEAAIRLAPRESAYLLLADIEEAGAGDQGKVKEWLSRALRAPRDPAWVADGVASPQWAPISPVTGRLDAFQWKAPVERLAPTIELDEPQPTPALIDTSAHDTIEAEVVADGQVDGSGPTEGAKRAIEVEPSVDGDGHLSRLPDDPGVEPAREDTEPRRFKLF